ncbi:MAG: TOBE domain-containing protein [Chromatiales bacterium]|jgi:ABC-type molybdate transport system ATPase subunit
MENPCFSNKARLIARSTDHLGLAPGRSVWVQVKSVAVLTR